MPDTSPRGCCQRGGAKDVNTAAGSSVTSVQVVQTAALKVSYEEHGPAGGDLILLLHGWPYDPWSFDHVAPQLERNPSDSTQMLLSDAMPI